MEDCTTPLLECAPLSFMRVRPLTRRTPLKHTHYSFIPDSFIPTSFIPTSFIPDNFLGLHNTTVILHHSTLQQWKRFTDALASSLESSTEPLAQELKRLFDVVIALDTEWTLEEPYPEPPTGITLERIPEYPHKLANCILSYQMVTVNTQTSQKAETILYPEPEHRYTLGALILEACKLLGISQSRFIKPDKDNTPDKYMTWKPLRVCVVWHWGSAEVGALADRTQLMQHEKEIKVIGGAVVTLKPLEWRIPLPSHHKSIVLLTLRDTSRLADEHTKLEDLGQALGLPKVDISPYSKDRMDILLAENKLLYERYAMTDAQISLKWLFSVAKTNREVLQVPTLLPTTGSASALGLKTFLGEDFNKAFGVERVNKEYQTQRPRAAYDSFPTQSFLGGANQTYHLGHVQGTILDLDLSGAYGAAMGVLPVIDWESPEVCNEREPRKLRGLMAFALVRFIFPSTILYPCLPVPTKHGIIYPLSCTDYEGTFVTGPEIYEALLLGAQFDVLKSIIYPTQGLLLADYVRYLTAQRRQFPDKSDPRNAAAKLAINSLYGKFGQGLANRYTNVEIFSQVEIDEGKKMPHSLVTLPHAAATITGLVRAVLNVLVLEASKIGTVLSATTDGIMLHIPQMVLTQPVKKGVPHLDPPRALIQACEKHPSVQLLRQGRRNIGENPNTWLEVKYAGNEAYTVKTRINYIGWNRGTVNRAMVGLKKEDIDFHELINIREQRLPRYYTDHTLHKITDVIEGKACDITSHYTSKELNLAPDWKRKFGVDGASVPFASMEDWQDYRKVVDRLRSEAFPERVEQVKRGKRTRPGKTQESSTLWSIQKAVLHRIALHLPGFRLPKGMSERQACTQLAVAPNTLTKLKRERKLWAPLPDDHPEVARIQTLLGLW